MRSFRMILMLQAALLGGANLQAGEPKEVVKVEFVNWSAKRQKVTLGPQAARLCGQKLGSWRKLQPSFREPRRVRHAASPRNLG